MKKYSVLTILTIFFLTASSSCSDGGGGGLVPTGPLEPVELNKDENKTPLTSNALLGTWQIFDFQKAITDSKGIIHKMRYTENDGYRIVFLDDKNYYEENVNEGRVVTGTYKVKEGTNYVDFVFEFDDPSEGAEGEYKSTKRIPTITNKRYIMEDEYKLEGLPGATIKDTRQYRKDKNWLPDAGRGSDRVKITFAQITGKWVIKEHLKIEEGVTVVVEELAGQWYEFYTNGTFKSYTKEDVLLEEGRLLIVEDVLHLIYPSKEEVGGMLAAIMWVPKGVKQSEFEVYLKDATAKKGSSKIIIRESRTQFERKI